MNKDEHSLVCEVGINVARALHASLARSRAHNKSFNSYKFAYNLKTGLSLNFSKLPILTIQN